MGILHISTNFFVYLSNTLEENTAGLSGEPVVRLEGSRFFKKIKKCIFPHIRLLNMNLQSVLLRKMFYLSFLGKN